MLQITLRELKDRKWSLLVYCLGSLALLWIYVATFRSSQLSSQQLQELVKSYPKGLLNALGMSNLDLDTIEKYLNAKHFSLMWPLIAIILALSRSAGQIAGEIQNGTMGLLLALPLKRWQVFAAKYAAGLATIMIFTAASVFGIIPLASAYSIPSHFNILASAWVLTSLFMLVIYSLGLAISVGVSDKAKVYAVAGVFLLGSYAAYIVALISHSLSWLKHFSLFYYFDTQGVLAGGRIMPKTWLVFGLIITLATGLAAWKFSTRDVAV